MNKNIFTENAPAPVGPYSQAVLSGNTLYCSGQIAIGFLDCDVMTQTEKICENIEKILAAAGMQLSDVVKTMCFLADMKDFAEFNKCYEKHFAHRPARSCVAARDLPKGALVEVEVISVL